MIKICDYCIDIEYKNGIKCCEEVSQYMPNDTSSDRIKELKQELKNGDNTFLNRQMVRNIAGDEPRSLDKRNGESVIINFKNVFAITITNVEVDL